MAQTVKDSTLKEKQKELRKNHYLATKIPIICIWFTIFLIEGIFLLFTRQLSEVVSTRIVSLNWFSNNPRFQLDTSIFIVVTTIMIIANLFLIFSTVVYYKRGNTKQRAKIKQIVYKAKISGDSYDLCMIAIQYQFILSMILILVYMIAYFQN